MRSRPASRSTTRHTRISSTLVGATQPKDVYDVGQKVQIVYEDHPVEGFTLPRFRIID